MPIVAYSIVHLLLKSNFNLPIYQQPRSEWILNFRRSVFTLEQLDIVPIATRFFQVLCLDACHLIWDAESGNKEKQIWCLCYQISIYRGIGGRLGVLLSETRAAKKKMAVCCWATAEWQLQHILIELLLPQHLWPDQRWAPHFYFAPQTLSSRFRMAFFSSRPVSTPQTSANYILPIWWDVRTK